MSERRITTNEERHTPKLKTIAGLIQGLTYREMNELTELLAQEMPGARPDALVEALLNVTDKLLAPPAAPQSNFR
ncbi:hypothetical protein HJB53_29985 [Rhizobium lentis]|uniref:hypothetical protein n=1 Tax=Rhizobium lentis TaxID=1138194 RepID=UPI001C8290FE|nr:hypothetical protein [Rhizobium lentis]MBX5130721.1 hypothetical protein [Rhizobium lentis]